MRKLKEIDLSQAAALMQKINAMQQAVDEEKKRLTEMLVSLNLEYYGSSPSKYYKSIQREYRTEDDFFVKIDSGTITITKKITDNLTVIYKDRFDETTNFNILRCTFVYDSGRHVHWSGQKQTLAEKHSEQCSRFEEILREEQVYNPFTDFGNYISFTDFFK